MSERQLSYFIILRKEQKKEFCEARIVVNMSQRNVEVKYLIKSPLKGESRENKAHNNIPKGSERICLRNRKAKIYNILFQNELVSKQGNDTNVKEHHKS